MLSITHAAVGGAIGSLVASPVIAFGLGVASHIVIDKISHFWPKRPMRQLVQIIFDTVGTLLMLYVIYKLAGSLQSTIFWGALGGAFVDFMLVLVFKVYPKLWDSKLRRWHESRQPHKTNPVYLFTDILQTIIGLAIIYFVR